jgi:DNA-binding NarL/FixJ family response regulator
VSTVLVLAATGIARAGLERLVASNRTFRVIVATPAVPLAQQVEAAEPDVIVLGARDLASAARDLGRLPRPPGLVLLTDDADAALEADGILRVRGDSRQGRAILPSDPTAEQLCRAIDAVTAGLVVLHPSVVAALGPRRRVSIGQSGALSQPLTPRETEVLGMIAEGLGNKIVAARLGISEHTVKFHIASIFAKLGAGSRTEAVRIGIQRGLVMI